MTTIFPGCALEQMLRVLEGDPSRYVQIVICSPFLDDQTMARLIGLAAQGRQRGCGVRLITSEQHRNVARQWPGADQVGTRTLVLVPHLHAKVYLAIGRNRSDSWVAVTSANMTQAALRRNIEIGLLVRACSPEGARTVEQVRWFLEKLATAPKET